MNFSFIKFLSSIMAIQFVSMNIFLNGCKIDGKKLFNEKYFKAVYFSGKEILRYKNISITFTTFSFAMKIKVEGGQFHKIPIIRLYDSCTSKSFTELVVGLTTSKDGGDLRLFTSIRLNSESDLSTIESHGKINIEKWYDLTVTYDRISLMLFVDNAKVGAIAFPINAFFKNIFINCITLDVGGDCRTKETFRGSVTEIHIWNTSIPHKDINNAHKCDTYKNALLFKEDFSETFIHEVGFLKPQLDKIYIDKHLIEIEPPKCGLTICDNPEIIKNYAEKQNKLLLKKTIRCRLINLMNNDYSNPMFDEKTLSKNNNKLNEIFSKYNITFVFHEVKINNTYLRNKTIVTDCYGHCEGDALSHCNVKSKPIDCSKLCSPNDIGNGICNPECNKPTKYYEGRVIGLNYSWDLGDCCLENNANVSKTCYDYNSPLRAFLSEYELKDLVNLKNEKYLNIYPVNIKPNVLGKSTFPWDPKRYGKQGGVLTNAKDYNKGKIIDLIHELGHAFGLWHVHKGVSEISHCDDDCAERYPSMTHGDLCSDTNPTPGNPFCKKELVDTSCANKHYVKLPYNNFMGYTSGNCTNRFTQQQMARMHCYIDKYYQRWSTVAQPPSKIPIKPRVVLNTNQLIEITWMKPIGEGSESLTNNCDRCTNLNEFQQYADAAISPSDNTMRKTYMFNKHSSDEFTGPPDVQYKCKADDRAWIPQSGCPGNCMIEAEFSVRVILRYLKIWVTYQAGHTIENIELVTETNQVVELGGAITQCDTPFTMRIDTKHYIKAIRVFVTSQMVGLDSIMITSSPDDKFCRRCTSMKPLYRVYRNPPFPLSPFIVRDTFLKDHISYNMTYHYWIASSSGNYISLLSPPLVFKLTDGFCGNGRIEKHLGEECDDANIRNGDGCNVECQQEKVFNCKLEPSLCYRYDKDGICEDFEREKNGKECFSSTPNGYVEQWATLVTGHSGQSTVKCPEKQMEGPVQRYLTCVRAFEKLKSIGWRPCKRLKNNVQHKKYILFFKYEKPVYPSEVLIYLASDGASFYQRSFLDVSIIDNMGIEYNTSENPYKLSCQNNPLVVSINERLQNIKTNNIKISFQAKYRKIAISSVTLRSKNGKCAENETYHVLLQLCFTNDFAHANCTPFELKNASYNCFLDNGIAVCNVLCKQGFIPEKTFISYCYHGNWQNRKSCSPKNCGIPQIKNGKTNKDCKEFTYGVRCSFTCNKDSNFYGKRPEIECSSNGFWVMNGFCYKVCPRAVNIGEDLEIELNSNSRCHSVEGVERFSMGTWCSLECPNGYKLPNTSKLTFFVDNHVNAYCESNGKWRVDSYCEKIKCPDLTEYEKLLYNCSNENYFQSRCITTCSASEEKQHEFECLSNGSWSKVIHQCDLKVNCNVPLSEETQIDFSSCTANNSGQTCHPICNPDGETKFDVILDSSDYETDVKMYCMPSGEWLPSPDSFSCTRACVVEDIGNDWCDCHNNNKHCKYDGGDCCPYTPLSSCACVDPKQKPMKITSQMVEESGDGSGSEEYIDTEDGDDDYY